MLMPSNTRTPKPLSTTVYRIPLEFTPSTCECLAEKSSLFGVLEAACLLVLGAQVGSVGECGAWLKNMAWWAVLYNFTSPGSTLHSSLLLSLHGQMLVKTCFRKPHQSVEESSPHHSASC